MSISQENIRTAMLVGEEALSRYRNARVAVFGVGGVGGYVCEGLARAGIGALDLFDHDTVSLSNINRQIIALHSTVGQKKVDVMAARIADIHPDCRVRTYPIFYLPENADEIDLSQYDYIVDAIDLVSCKLSLILNARERNIPIISAMGTGNKMDPTQFRITDISKTSGCHLARIMRKELRNRGILHHTVLYSEELPQKPEFAEEPPPGRRSVPASLSWVPSVAGLMLGGHVIRTLAQQGK